MGDALWDFRAAQRNGGSLWDRQQVRWELWWGSASKWAIHSDAHLDLVLPKEEELVRDVKTSVSLGGRDHEIVVPQIPREMGKESSRAQTLDRRE